MEQTKTTAFRYAIKWGAIIGLSWITITLVKFLTHQAENKYWEYPVMLVIAVGIGYLIKNYRLTYSDGNISFGKAFILCFQIYLYATILCTIFSLSYIHYLMPHTFDIAIEHSKQELIKKGMSDDQIANAMKITKLTLSPYVQFFVGILSGAFIGAIISLIVAAITKKEKPETVTE